MEKKRIGNDTRVTMAVTTAGRPENFDNKRLTLILWSDVTSTEVKDFRVKGNIITFMWYGTEQKKTGRYFLTLYENYGERSQRVVDSRPFVQLVSRSFMTGCGCDCDGDNAELTLSVDIDAPTNDYNDLENKPKINGVTLEGNLTSDDLKIESGSFGEFMTEEDMLDMLGDWVPEQETK